MSSVASLVRLAIIVLVFIGISAYLIRRSYLAPRQTQIVSNLVLGYAVIQFIFMMFLWINHMSFPFNLETMELTVLAHTRRILDGLPLYSESSPEFVALAYNPLYYFLSVPFVRLFGANLSTMRLVSVLGMLGSGLMIFLIVRKGTGSGWWGLISVGLFAAAYRVMETYLDNAFPDSWMLFTILLGCFLIDQNRSWITNLAGILLLVSSYWFKQPGAVFAIGALVYLTWRDGFRKSWPFWLIALVLGPGLYYALPNGYIGARFHYFTSGIPRQWIQFDWRNILRVLLFLTSSYFFLAIISLAISILVLLRERNRSSIWFWMLPFAIVSCFPGFLDPESANNLYIALGVWFIITGMIGLKEFTKIYNSLEQKGIYLAVIVASFALFFYNPMNVIVTSQAHKAYRDLTVLLKTYDGTIYAPWIGQLQDTYKLYPSVHWVPMVDMIRPGYEWKINPLTTELLQPVISPSGNAYILVNYPLKEDPILYFLSDYYVLEADFGERFAPLKQLPKRFDIGWPRYLYRYGPKDTAARTEIAHNP